MSRSIAIAVLVLGASACQQEASDTLVTPSLAASAADAGEVAGRHAGGRLRQAHAGLTFGCGIWDGEIRCWGDAEYAELYQLLDAPAGDGWVALSGGAWNTCALHKEGHHVCWGDGWANPLVIDGAPNDELVDFSLGTAGGIGLMSDQTLRVWGSDVWGQVTEMPHEGKYADVATGYGWVCALRVDAQLDCWGIEDDEGIWYEPHATAALAPATIDRIEPYARGMCGWLDGDISCWGASSEAETELVGLGVTHIDGGDTFLCAIRDGQVECYGDLWISSVGWLSMADSAPSGDGWQRVVCGPNHCCADQGEPQSIACWGDNTMGQLNTSQVTQ